MDKRYSVHPEQFKRMTSDEMRGEFLIETLFAGDEVKLVYSHVDRMVALGCMPVEERVPLDKGIDVWACFGVSYLLERRELGVFNVGGAGEIEVDGERYRLNRKDCLYVAMGARSVVFSSDDPQDPARFYMVSAPAHRAYETRLLTFADAAKRPLGALETANKRVINQFIHPSVLPTCQLSMGLTELDPGSVWNTMPAHTHERRMEIYFYFEIPPDQAVFHMMGQGDETRHVVVRDMQAVISPSWSIHAGAGTCSYAFIWAMGGENQAFDDMDGIGIADLR